MAKDKIIIKIMLLAIFLLLSLPVLYLCAMNIFIEFTHGTSNSIPISIYIVTAVIILLLDIAAIVGQVKILKRAAQKGSPMQTEESTDTPMRQKFLKNRWFVIPLILPFTCFAFSVFTEFISKLMAGPHGIVLLKPYFNAVFALDALSAVLITLAFIPLVIITIILKGIKKISLAEMLVSFGCNFFILLYAAIMLGSNG